MTIISEMLTSAVFSVTLSGDFNVRKEEQRKNTSLGAICRKIIVYK
jgi:hypothetical protein